MITTTIHTAKTQDDDGQGYDNNKALETSSKDVQRVSSLCEREGKMDVKELNG